MRIAFAAVALFVLAPLVAAQVTKADYDRANSVFKWTGGKVTSAKIEAHWTPDGTRFWYKNAQKEFVQCASIFADVTLPPVHLNTLLARS